MTTKEELLAEIDALRAKIEAFKEPEFDWGTVQNGMAFISKTYGLVWYIGPAFIRKDEGACYVTGQPRHLDSNDVRTTVRSYLTRAPEHDLEV